MGRWIGAIALGVGLGAVGAFSGHLSGGLCPTQGEIPGLDSSEMAYYLGNQAFFSGDTEGAAAALGTLAATGVKADDLCPGMMLKVVVKEEAIFLCDPDSLTPPDVFLEWASERESQAQVALLEGDFEAAEAGLKGLLAADPYRISSRGLLIAALRGQGKDGEIFEHGAALVAQSQGRLLAVEVGETHQL